MPNYQFVFSKVLIVLFFFYYQGQKGEPGDIVDVSMNPLQVVTLNWHMNNEMFIIIVISVTKESKSLTLVFVRKHVSDQTNVPTLVNA